MDSFDAFYQQLDSEALLKRHGPQLVAEAREILHGTPDAKIAGVVLTADSLEAVPFREMIANATGQPVPAAMMVGICPRAMVEQVLTA